MTERRIREVKTKLIDSMTDNVDTENSTILARQISENSCPGNRQPTLGKQLEKEPQAKR